MKNMAATIVLAGTIITCMVACNAKSDNNNNSKDDAKNETSGSVIVDKEKIKDEIQAKEDEFAEVYNSGKLKNIGYYAEDAVTFFQNRPPLVGREEIVAFLLADINTTSNTIMFKTNEVFVSSDGNQVVEIGNYKLIDSTKTVINTGNYMSLFEKRNGRYVCVRDMSASIMPAQ